VPPTLAMATKSASVEALSQINKATKLTADTATALLGIPDKNGGPIDLLGGLSDSLSVHKNTIFADAISNTAANTIDLVTATGSGTTSAATIGVLQVTSSAGTAGLSGTVKDSSIRINAQDIGAGGAATQTDNTITASATGNMSVSEISGDINPLLTSSEAGASKTQSGSPSLDADATVLVATVQSLSDIDAPLANRPPGHLGRRIDQAAERRAAYRDWQPDQRDHGGERRNGPGLHRQRQGADARRQCGRVHPAIR
jgi:hypothetical protein